MTLRQHLAEQAHLFLVGALEEANWDVLKACKAARVSQATLYRRVGKLRKRGKLVRARPLTAPLIDTIKILRLFGATSQSGDYVPWSMPRAALKETLLDAKAGYIKLVKRFHPDNGGDHETIVLLNDAWLKLERRFRRKGVVL